MSGDRESDCRVPDGVPRALKISQFAQALGVSERTVRSWVDRGTLPTLPTPPNSTRYILATELTRLEAEGWPVNWETLF